MIGMDVSQQDLVCALRDAKTHALRGETTLLRGETTSPTPRPASSNC